MMADIITTINPETEEVLERYPVLKDSEIEEKINTTYEAQKIGRNFSIGEKKKILQKIAQELNANKNDLALLAQKEMGKPIEQGISEVEKCATTANYYATNMEQFLSPEFITTEAKKSYVCFEPLGTVLAVMPWNFPFWQSFRCALPAISAGNAVLLKHASNVTGCALACEKILQASLPEKNLFQALVIPSTKVNFVIAHPKTHAISFTGSTEVGKKIASQAGEHLKKSVLELGGSDAYVVLKDADIEEAAKFCAISRLINSGQSCIAAKRFIVEKEIYDQFVSLLIENMKNISLGPLARADLRNDLHQQVEKSIKQGAKLLLGGMIPENKKGYFYPATVLGEVQPNMPAFQEELFGPVAAVIKAISEENAIELANQSSFGLGAAVFTKDLLKGENIARHKLFAGSCFVNTFVRSDPRLPFGGIKFSGFGRELSHYGLKEFVNIKTVYVHE